MLVLEDVERLGPLVGSLRTLGSAALALAYVAAGWLDAYSHLSFHLWDAAAGVLLVEEAGGAVSRPNGTPWSAAATDCLASNGHLHEALLRALAP